jgi:hypothetical protein
MARTLTFEFQGEQIKLALDKIDRDRLYGYVETEVVDDAGKPCRLGTLLADGHSLVLPGGTGLAYLSYDGQWRKKAELRPVDPQGQLIPPVKSTFDTGVRLEQQATVEEYLEHNTRLVYQLTPEEPCPALLERLRGGAIYRFPFSYRGGVVADAGFLLLGSDGNLFMCVGTPADIKFIGLKETAGVVPDDEDASEEEDDSLDFSMV